MRLPVGTLVAPFLLLPFVASAQERRCLELESDGNAATHCGCSEPLDNNDTVPSSGFWDPSDSPDNLECQHPTANPNPLGLGINNSLNTADDGKSVEIVPGLTGGMVLSSSID